MGGPWFPSSGAAAGPGGWLAPALLLLLLLLPAGVAAWRGRRRVRRPGSRRGPGPGWARRGQTDPGRGQTLRRRSRSGRRLRQTGKVVPLRRRRPAG